MDPSCRCCWDPTYTAYSSPAPHSLPLQPLLSLYLKTTKPGLRKRQAKKRQWLSTEDHPCQMEVSGYKCLTKSSQVDWVPIVSLPQAPWDCLPNKLLVLKSLSSPLLGEPNLKQQKKLSERSADVYSKQEAIRVLAWEIHWDKNPSG